MIDDVHRVFSGPLFKIVVWIMISISIAWTIAFFFGNLFQCWPISMNWAGLGGPPEYCINTSYMYLGQSWSDVFIDGMESAHCAKSLLLRFGGSHDTVHPNTMYLEPSDESHPQAVNIGHVSPRVLVSVIRTWPDSNTNRMSRVVGAGIAKLVVFREIAYDTSTSDLDITC